MHGRLKVKSAAHLETERHKAREEKLTEYRKTMAAIFQLRKEFVDAIAMSTSPKDDSLHEKVHCRLLKMTGGLLTVNPAITTLWNIRRQVVLNLLETSKTLVIEDKVGRSKGCRDILIASELELTQLCLNTDQKSYGAWHHRGWSMLRAEEPDWLRELRLCKDFLSQDERNFHCWDYRRFVVENLPVDDRSAAERELEFSVDKIHANFSNYSAWHYRSKLLPVVFPSLDSPIGVEERVCRDELDLVQNAAFTDPEDSSVWFYHRWLLKRGGGGPKFKLVKRTSRNGRIIVATSRNVAASSLRCIEFDCIWESPNGQTLDSLWISDACPTVPCTLVVSVDSKVTDTVAVQVKDFFYVSPDLRLDEPLIDDAATKELLEAEMRNCRELLELEPNSKWTLLTLAFIAQTVNPSKYFSEILKAFEILVQVDTSRRNYYKDQMSKFVIRQELIKMFAANDGYKTSGDGEVWKLDLSRKHLTAIYYKHLLSVVEELIIESNDIVSVDALVPHLIECRKFFLNGDNIATVSFRNKSAITDFTRPDI